MVVSVMTLRALCAQQCASFQRKVFPGSKPGWARTKARVRLCRGLQGKLVCYLGMGHCAGVGVDANTIALTKHLGLVNP